MPVLKFGDLFGGMEVGYKYKISLDKSKANAQEANNMSRKMGRDSQSNWWATDVPNIL